MKNHSCKHQFGIFLDLIGHATAAAFPIHIEQSEQVEQ